MTVVDEHADQLAEVAVELAVRIRDDDPEANGRWLKAELPDSADWFRLAFVLAAAVPDDQPWTSLTDWIAGLKPCGEAPPLPPDRRTQEGRMADQIRIESEEQASQWLGQLRRVTKLRQTDIAERLHVSVDWVRTREQGRVSLGIDDALAMLREAGYGLAIVPLIESGQTEAPASTVSDQGMQMHTRVGVDHSSGSTGLSGGTA